jgi:hypothetical protein
MTWLEAHTRSEELASAAEIAERTRRFPDAILLYHAAAQEEDKALSLVDEKKSRTVGILAVSAAALYIKARCFQEAERTALRGLNRPSVREPHRFQLRQLLQDAWIEQDKSASETKFLPGQVQVAVKGGQVIYGGAPLDLIVDKVKTIQAIFYRTIEDVRGEPLRKRGLPKPEIVDSCRPWLFQAPPGSYQFAVAVEKPDQPDFFREDIDPQRVVQQFLSILRAGVSGDPAELEQAVPRKDYRDAFLKLTRALAPPVKGDTFSRLEIRGAGDRETIEFGTETRQIIGKKIKQENPTQISSEEQLQPITGVLRGLHLDKDWIEILHGTDLVKVYGIRDTLEDVIGPMTNRKVIATVRKPKKGRLTLVDIELDE